MRLFSTVSGDYKLERIPNTKVGDLRAWDAADELLVQFIFDEKLATENSSILIVNDAFGALSVALSKLSIHNWSDSYLSHLAMDKNLKLNHLSSNSLKIPSTDDLKQHYDLVIIKVPKTLALLEDQLYRLHPHLSSQSMIIAAGMSKHIHTSTLKLFEKIIGTTSTSRATKKARLIFTKKENKNHFTSPYPKSITLKELDLQINNHANVFSKDNLDIGSRFLIEQIQDCPSANHIIDLGCGNGVLGIMAQQLQPTATIHFVDESYMAIQSAKENFAMNRTDTSAQAHFYISNCLSAYDAQKPELILCNPPFHQAHSMGDQIAWEMFKQSQQKLEHNGELWVVANRHLGYHIKLKRLFGNCKTIASNKKFVVLSSKKGKN